MIKLSSQYKNLRCCDWTNCYQPVSSGNSYIESTAAIKSINMNNNKFFSLTGIVIQLQSQDMAKLYRLYNIVYCLCIICWCWFNMFVCKFMSRVAICVPCLVFKRKHVHSSIYVSCASYRATSECACNYYMPQHNRTKYIYAHII